ncbi:hypothetical protein ACFFWC_19620 [Plantactinospora siamensis]|uniref:hypothetical protein n=1 Tax=Plantactinospora siamensis TaxID=555372 RepID=UPI0035EF13C9
MLIRLATVLMLLLASGCTNHPQRVSEPGRTSAARSERASFQPPGWTSAPPIPSKQIGNDPQAVGWDGGFLLVNGEGGAEGRDEVVYASKDGHTFRVATPEAGIQPSSCCDRIVAANGAAAYLLGWNTRNELVVWRTEDGSRWEAIPLELADLRLSRRDLELTIAAGPHGVMIVGRDSVAPPRHHGVYVWSSPDGRTFTAVTRVPGPVDTAPVTATLAATPQGFLLAMAAEKETRLLSSADGVHWQNIGAGFVDDGAVDHLASNADTTVMFAHRPGPEEPAPWYRRGGQWRRASLDPGRLPDAGVVPAEQLRVVAVHNWGTGFIAVGNTFGNEGQERSGLVWYSVDGSAWTRMPTRGNGFDRAWNLIDLLVSGRSAMLIGCGSDESAWLCTWKADVP